ncbi:aKG-HExxH-type peptide beta-hydroxylase [Nonomuraea sp. NPDC050540]|uniref:aKG-HExxH-type peptide beta-hydroxylase n=1 Tax=Nonomuraea sp. NPDC050540 TaxID=3364367 RepID=UPI00378F9046
MAFPGPSPGSTAPDVNRGGGLAQGHHGCGEVAGPASQGSVRLVHGVDPRDRAADRSESGTRSATSPSALGSVAMSKPPDVRSAALSLAHEVQHAKLAAVMILFDLVRPDVDRLFYAAWREDPRPANALLQGAFAHMGVARFWQVQRALTPGGETAHIEFVRWRDAALVACRNLLGEDVLTAPGHMLRRSDD